MINTRGGGRIGLGPARRDGGVRGMCWCRARGVSGAERSPYDGGDVGGDLLGANQTDPELVRQLDEAKGTDDPVNAVVRLQRQKGAAPDPKQVQEQMQRAIDRTAETTGEQPLDVNVLSRLGVGYISGSEKFVRELVEQPEVVSAVANQSDDGESGKIAPVPSTPRRADK
jgi:hypothetical protein